MDLNYKVSIITAVYNSEKYIKDTIESVLSQTYQNWEWFIVNDCSSDRTIEVIRNYDDSRINLINLEKNVGAAQARNIGLEKAKTDYIAFIDADDMWDKHKLEKQLDFMVRNNFGFTYTSYRILGKNKPIEVPSSLNYSQYMKNTIIGMLTVMIDRKIVGDFRIVDIRKDHDSMTWAKLLKNNKAYGLNEPLAYYRKVDGSISNNKFEAVKNHWKNCREIEKLSTIKTLYYFMFYSLNAVRKHFL